MKRFFLITALICFGVSVAGAQTAAAGDEDVQSWNEVSLTVPVNERLDFYTAFTLRFGTDVTRLSDGRYAVGVVYKPNKSWSVQPFYWFIDARNSRGRFKAEQRLNLRLVYRFPVKSFGLSHRSAFEYRLREPRNSFRYRPSLTFEKNIPKNIVPKAKFFVTEEVFYDSIPNKFSRSRFTAGITKTLTKKLSLDLYFMRQNDGYAHPGDLSVAGTSWKIRL